MAARHCPSCRTNWPAGVTSCPTCQVNTAWDGTGEPDPDWEAKLRRARAADEPADPILTVQGELREHPLAGLSHTRLLSTHDVVRSGVLNRLAPDTVVLVEQPDGTTQAVEILAYRYADRDYVVTLTTIEAPDFVPKDWVKPKRRKRAG